MPQNDNVTEQQSCIPTTQEVSLPKTESDRLQSQSCSQPNLNLQGLPKPRLLSFGDTGVISHKAIVDRASSQRALPETHMLKAMTPVVQSPLSS